MALTKLNNRSVSAVTTLPSASTSNFLTSTHVQQVTNTQGSMSVANNGTWTNLCSCIITPTKAGNVITVEASFVYPKETSNFMNVNSYRIGFGSTYVILPSESFCYSDPWTHQYMTGLGHHSYNFVVDQSQVGVAQTAVIQWVSANGTFDFGTYLMNGYIGTAGNIACRINAIERK